MKIKEVTAVPVRAPQTGPVSGHLPYGKELSKFIRTGYTSCFVKIESDDGVVGVGESLVREVPEATAAIIEKLLRPILLGNSIYDIDVLWERMYATMRTRGHTRGYLLEAISGVDLALWDLLGKQLDLPVHKLIGGAQSRELKAYASSILFGKPKAIAREATKLVDEGHRQIKLKVGMTESEDVANVKAVRDAVGYEVDLMVDANSAFSASEAVRRGRKFERYECFWFEEPVPPDNMDGYIEVSRKLDIPIAGGESYFSRYDFRDLIARDAVDIVMPDIGRAGGISECRKIASMASAFGKLYTPHIGLSGAGVRAATLQFACTLPRELFLTYEYYRIPNRPNPLATDVVKRPIEVFRGGYVEVPQRPGLGIELDEEALKRYAV